MTDRNAPSPCNCTFASQCIWAGPTIRLVDTILVPHLAQFVVTDPPAGHWKISLNFTLTEEACGLMQMEGRKERLTRAVLLALAVLTLAVCMASHLAFEAAASAWDAPRALTIWTETAMDEAWRSGSHTEPVWLARLESSADDAVLLGLVWRRESSGWFATWRLHLYSDTGLLPSSQTIDLLNTAPLGGRTYHAALSYDPATGAYSAQVTDVGTGQRLVSTGGVLATYDGTLHPEAWNGAAYHTQVQRTESAYIPVAAQWHVEGVLDEAGELPRILPPGQPLTLHLTTHGSPAPGTFRFYITHAAARNHLFTVDAEASDGITVTTGDRLLPHGLFTLEMEYQGDQDGPILLSEALELSHGAVEFHLASVTPDSEELHGLLEISSPFDLPPSLLQIEAELASLEWNEATRTYKATSLRPLEIFDAPVALAPGTNPLPFTLPAPNPNDGIHWRLRLRPRLDFPIAQVEHESEATFSLGSDACRLDVMSFNIRVPANDGINTWPNRRPVVERMLHEYTPAVIGMQEPADVQLYDLDGMLTDYRSIRIRPDARARVHNALFYRPDVVELLAWGRYWLSDTPDVAQSSTWGNSEARAVLWARFRSLATGDTFYVLNTHFHHIDSGETIRTRSAQLILDRLADVTQGLPVILMGDFNAMPGTPAHRLFVEGEKAPFIDAWQAAAARTGPEGTYHGFTGRSGGNRIDWLLVTPDIDVLSAEHVTYSEGDLYPSDHFPVYVTLCLPGAR